MTTPKDHILKKLKTIYRCALNGNKWDAALQVAVLLGKEIGMFGKQRLPEIMSIADMTEPQLHEFIAALEKFEPELKNLEGEPAQDFMKKASNWNHSQPELKPPQFSARV